MTASRLAIAAISLLAMAGILSCYSRTTSPEAPTPAQSTASASAELSDYRELGFTFPSAPNDEQSRSRNDEQLQTLNAACADCHHTDRDSMHTSSVRLACVDCHGGPRQPIHVPARLHPGDREYERLKNRAHVHPTADPDLWKDSANPPLAYTALLRESPDFVRFINPGDLRAARVACGACHAEQVRNVPRSMMAHGAMLWEAALYNNGAINRKSAIYGEQYAPGGEPAEVIAWPLPTVSEEHDRGMLPALFPIPRWEVTQPGNLLRVFERGGQFTFNTGLPDPNQRPGSPDDKLTTRGRGTNLSTDPVYLGLQKTRLFDPTLNLPGTNDHPGDFRAGGCTACHVVFANDRSPVHSTFWSGFGNRGESFSTDATINRIRPTTQPYSHWTLQSPRSTVHPIQHAFVRNMPASSCIVCHVHPGTNVLNSFLGYMWWDNESDGWSMYPRNQINPTAQEEYEASLHNPEAAAARGLWSDLYPKLQSHAGRVAGPDFLENVSSLNPDLKHNHFADFHGHGWVFRAVFKKDRAGRLLDYAGNPVDSQPANIASKMEQAVAFQQKPGGPAHPPANVPVHLKDIHLEKGMQCVDCHFSTDSHGDGNLYGETRNAITIDCIDCHGTVERPAAILSYFQKKAAGEDKAAADFLAQAFTGNAATANISRANLLKRNAELIRKHFNEDESIDSLVQKSTTYTEAKIASDRIGSVIDPDKFPRQWTIPQVADTVKRDFKVPDAPDDRHRASLARYAHTVRRNMQWGTLPDPHDNRPDLQLAHSSTRMACYTCHSAWNTSCFGCHLPQKSNQRTPMLHNEGTITRNYTSYNFQTLRDDIYMLGIDSTVKGHKIVPVRSSCAILVSSQNANREWVYSQQQTVSAEGFSGTAFSPDFPHTVRSAETKQCTDCHVSRSGDNNAVMAELLIQGAKAVNFIGRYAWVAEANHGLEAVVVSERDEPQAVIGSRLHEMAYPDFFRKHVENGRRLTEAYGHAGQVLDLQLRGEYLYAACGPDGFIAYDVANIDNKGFSQRITSSPVSALGQRLAVPSRFATSICSPSTMALNPTRPHRPENDEGSIHPLYAYLYLTDRDEGLIVIGNPPDDHFTGPGVSTLLDGNPENNFLRRAVTYNPNGLLNGARHMDLYGTLGFVSCDAGLVVIDLNDPLHPRHVTTLSEGLRHPRKVAFQFRYGFVVDDDGIKVLDMTLPQDPWLISHAIVPMSDARDLYLCRTYGYVAAGRDGLVILDLTRPEYPALDQTFTASGTLNDATAVRIGMTNTSLFAYVADGKNGLKVLQLTSPDDTPTFAGFSPRPAPRLIAAYPTRGSAIALSEGLDRDRGVDEAGNQLSVFGRRGSRPFNLPEQRTLFFHHVPAPPALPDRTDFYTVTDSPPASYELPR